MPHSVYAYSLCMILGMLTPCLAGAEIKHKRSLPLPLPEVPVTNERRQIAEDTESEGPTTPAADPAVVRLTGSTDPDAAAGGNPCTAQHSIETFMQIPSSSKPEAGKQGGVFFVSDLRDTPQLFFQSAAGNWPQQLTTFPDGLAAFLLSPDKEKILLTTSVGGDEQYDLYLLTIASKRLEPLKVDRSYRIQSMAWGPKSDWVAFTSNERGKETGNNPDMDLYRLDLKTRKTERLVELSGSNSVADVSPDGNWIALTTYRSVTESDVLLWDSKLKKLDTPTKHSGEESNHAVAFSADSRHLFLLSDRGLQTSQLFTLPLQAASPATLKPFTAGKWEVEDVKLAPDRRSVALITNEDGYGRLTAFHLDRSGKKTAPLVLPKNLPAVVSGISFAPVHGRASFFFSGTGPTQSSEVWLWNTGRTVQWTRSALGVIPKQCLAEERLVHYPTFDKREVPAFLFFPPQKTTTIGQPIPFVVYVHGGPEAQTRPIFSKTFQYFLQRGFGIFAPNIRGSTGYGKDFTLLDNYKKRMDSVRDVVAGAEWLVQKGYSRKGQMAIFGGSYGGFLVLRSIQVAPDLFAAASSSVGIANFVTFLKNTKPYRRALREVEYGPLSDEAFLNSISPLNYVEQMNTPLYLFHGANDPRVPVSEAEQIIEALRRRGVAVDYKIFPDEGHGNTKLRNILEQSRLMTLFFERHLGKRP